MSVIDECHHTVNKRSCLSCRLKRIREQVFKYSTNIVAVNADFSNLRNVRLLTRCDSGIDHNRSYNTLLRYNREQPDQFNCQCTEKLRKKRSRNTRNCDRVFCMHPSFAPSCRVCQKKKLLANVFERSKYIVEASLVTNKRRHMSLQTLCTKGKVHLREMKYLQNNNTWDEQQQYDCYCVNNVLKKARYERTSFKKYGVRHPMQNPVVFSKNRKSAFEFKDYPWPSKTITKYQGWENMLYDQLLDIYTENEIIVEKKLKKIAIPYVNVKGESAVYYPDARVGNTLYECKSTYTATIDKNLQLKMAAVVAAGYEAQLWVFKNPKIWCRVVYSLDNQIKAYHPKVE